MGVVAPGVAANLVGVASTTTAAGVTAAVVEAREVHQELVVAQDAAKGATGAELTGVVTAALGGHRRAAEQRTRSFSVGRLVHLLPLVLGLEHGPRRDDRGSKQKASISFPGGFCFLR